MRNGTRGFSLVELLVAMGLGIVVAGFAAYAFHNASKGSARAVAVVEANTQIQAVLNLLRSDLQNMHPCAYSSFNVTTSATTLQFLTSLPRLDTNYDGSVGTGDTNPSHDLCWVQWSITVNASGANITRGIQAANSSYPPSSPSFPNFNPPLAMNEISSPSAKGGFTSFNITRGTNGLQRNLDGSTTGTNIPRYIIISGNYSTAPGNDAAVVVPFRQVILIPH